MTLSRPALRALAAAGALAVLLTACGGDGDDDAQDTTTTTAAEETTTTAEETTTTTEAGRKGEGPEKGEDDPDEGGEDPDEGGDADALALTESIVLTEDDFVDGWTVEPNEALTALGRAIQAPQPERHRLENEAAERLRLRRLALFVERMSAPTA